jgi:hypothetical protein
MLAPMPRPPPIHLPPPWMFPLLLCYHLTFPPLSCVTLPFRPSLSFDKALQMVS